MIWNRNRELMRKFPVLREMLEITEREEALRDLLYHTYLSDEQIKKSELYKHAKSIKELLCVKDVDANIEKEFVRMGRNYDGGYVMYNDLCRTRYAYSFGINKDVSWDLAMSEAEHEIYMYDPTIKKLPQKNPRFHFEKIGIAAEARKQYKTLEELIAKNKHENEQEMIMKMDVEGCEWDVIIALKQDTLTQFKQIVMELHFLDNINIQSKICSALNKMNETHQVVHVHVNNFGKIYRLGDIVFPESIEVTYLNRKYYEFRDANKLFLLNEDKACDKRTIDVPLENWNEEKND